MGSRLDKEKNRLKSEPKDYTYTEAKSLLEHLGYVAYHKGRTSGSRVAFVKGHDKIMLHIPHPGNELKSYMVHDLKEHLEMVGELL